MLINTQALARGQGLTILAEATLVPWRDGRRCLVHRVHTAQGPQRWLWALPAPGVPLWWVVDLRRLSASVAQDVHQAHECDVPGTLMWGLRLQFTSAAELLGRVADEHSHRLPRLGTQPIEVAA